MNKSQKAAYVRRRSLEKFREHHCHWPGCSNQVHPAMWGCKEHWFRLPRYLRDKIWEAYRPGQEIDKNPSREYIAVAREVEDWIIAHTGAD